MSNNILDFQAFKKKRQDEYSDPLYQKQIDRMDKLQLLEEMIKFVEARSNAKDPSSTFWIIRGIILFTALERKCETTDMKGLASSFRRHLNKELEVKKGKK